MSKSVRLAYVISGMARKCIGFVRIFFVIKVIQRRRVMWWLGYIFIREGTNLYMRRGAGKG